MLIVVVSVLMLRICVIVDVGVGYVGFAVSIIVDVGVYESCRHYSCFVDGDYVGYVVIVTLDMMLFVMRSPSLYVCCCCWLWC